ncbi:MAG: sugar phosphate isomerase/epimerase family protein [Acidobacteriota bacterium]
MNRRAFLSAVGAAAILPSLPEAWSLKPEAWTGVTDARHSDRIKLGVASYSLRKFNLDQAIAMCKQMGARHITLKDVHLPRTESAEAMQAARQKITDAGMTLMGGGTISMKNDEAQVRKEFEYARRAGFPLMVAAPDPAALDIIERMIGDYNIAVAIHNHGPEDKHFPAPQDALKLVKNRDKRFGLCIDVGHTLRAGVDPVQAVAEAGSRVLDLHLKDLRSQAEKNSQTEVGKGVIDFPGLFRTLLKVGFTGHAALEYEINADDPLVGMRESLSYLRGVLDAI